MTPTIIILILVSIKAILFMIHIKKSNKRIKTKQDIIDLKQEFIDLLLKQIKQDNDKHFNEIDKLQNQLKIQKQNLNIYSNMLSQKERDDIRKKIMDIKVATPKELGRPVGSKKKPVPIDGKH